MVMKRTLAVALLSLVLNHIYAQDISKGVTFTDGMTVHASDLNTAIDNATILSTFYSGKGAGTPLTTDSLLFHQASTSTLKSVSLANLMTAGNAVNTSTVRAANTVLAGPTSGSSAAPTFRLISAADTAIATNTAVSSTIDWSSARTFFRTLTANTTYSFTNLKDGETVTVAVRQAAFGGPYTAAFTGVAWKGSVAPTQTTTANKVDLYTFIDFGGTIFGSASQSY